MIFEAGSRVDPYIVEVGNEGTKIIVIDEYSADLEALCSQAIETTSYQEDGQTAYPGLRAVLPDNYVHMVLETLVPLLRDCYDVPAELCADARLAYFSFLTKRESELEVLQRIPHFDTNKKHYYAVLHYLNAGEYGGTGFFRHRPTGFECITEDRRDIFIQSASAFMAVRGMPEQKYINSSTDHFELLDHVDYKPNRLIVYPGRILHSGLVSAAVDVSDSPATGRLTANTFIDFT